MKKHYTLLLSPTFLFLLIFSFVACPLFSQTTDKETGQTTDETSIIVSLNLQDVMKDLQDAPMEGTAAAKAKTFAMSLPMPDGSERSFTVEENDVIGPELAAQSPELKTYSLLATDNPAVYGRLTISPYGVRSTVFSSEGIITINPKDPSNPVLHLVQQEVTGDGGGFTCGVTGGHVSKDKDVNAKMMTTPFSNGDKLKKYRMAIVTTYHFFEVNGKNAGAAQSSLAAIVNSLSAIYERELAVRFEMIPPIIYASIEGAYTPNGGANYYTNPQAGYPFPSSITSGERTGFAAKAVAQHFQNPASYDIGHAFHGGTYKVFGTDFQWNGGIATTNGLCNDNEVQGYSPGLEKAAGWSSIPSGQATPGDVRLLAHEIGHMFSMPHTWNGNCSSCLPAAAQGNQVGDAYEIGDGTTIMSYRNVCEQFVVYDKPCTDETKKRINYLGITPSPGDDDDYFHNISLNRAVTHMAAHPGCGIETNTGNNPPVVNARPCGATYTVPPATPFRLTGSATDGNGDEVYYCWEQFDKGGVVDLPPPNNNTQGLIGIDAATNPKAPLFRSYPPTTSPTRTFPAMHLVATNNYVSDFEPLPHVSSRTMKFRLTGRDFKPGGGGIHYDTVDVNVSGTAGFQVTSNPGTVVAGDPVNVTWKLHGFTAVTNVRIKLSIDGGLTFPYTLNNSTPAADESETVTIPSTIPATTAARIMVESADYTCFAFFDLNNNPFTITSSCDPSAHNLCDVSAITAPEGDAALNLNNPPVFYTPAVTSFTMTPGSNTDPIGVNLTPQATGAGICTPYTNSGLGTVSKPFMVSKTGSYRFSDITGIASIYSAPYMGSMSCNNYEGSNSWDGDGTPGGGAGYAGSFSMNLIVCTQYYIVIKWGSASTIKVESPAGGSFYIDNTAAPTAGYTQTYVAVNTATGNIAAASATGDFTGLGAGSYEVYGAHYTTGGDPNTWVGQSLTQVQVTTCVKFSNNFKPLTIEPSANTPPSLAISGNPSADEGNCINTNFTFTVDRTGNVATQSTVMWAVTGSGANPADATDFLGDVLPGGTLNFPTGSQQKTITVTTKADFGAEMDEGFTVTLSSPVNATIGTTTATGTILDDDPFTSGCSGAYCAATHTGGTCGSADQYIANVEFAGIANNSDCDASLPGGYSDYTCFSASVSKGCNFPLLVTVGNPKSGDEVRAYFDWNGDEDFDDPGEEFTLTGSGTDFSKNITVPGTAFMGSVRMRVRLFASGETPAPCGSVAKGEAEDYCVDVGAAGISISVDAASKFEGNSGTTAYTFTVSRQCVSSVESKLNWVVSGTGTNPVDALDFQGFAFPEGTVTFPAGSTADQTITVYVTGDTDEESNEQFTITLSSQDNASIIIGSADGTIKNDDGINVWITGSITQNEGNAGTTAYTFSVNRNAFNADPTTVDWAVTGSGSHPATGSDFPGGVFPNGTISFPGNQAVYGQTITVNVQGDTDFEPSEGFTVSLSNPMNGKITNSSTNATILNDDTGPPLPTLSISGSPSMNEGNSGSSNWEFTVSRTGSIASIQPFAYTIIASGAYPADATDVPLLNDQVSSSIDMGQSTKTIQIEVNGDTDVEPDETFSVELKPSSLSNYNIGVSTATGTILDDEQAGMPKYSISGSPTFKEGDSGTKKFNFTVTRTGDISGASSVQADVTGSGTNPADVTDIPDMVLTWFIFFAAGETSKEFTVNVNGDTDVEPDEEFTVTLSGGVTINATASGTILNDDGTSTPDIAIQAGSEEHDEGNSGSTVYEFSVSTTGDLFSDSKVEWIALPIFDYLSNTANAADFPGGVFPSGTLTFPAGSTADQIITVNVQGDTDIELGENFYVFIYDAVNGKITNNQSIGIITADDLGTPGCLDTIYLSIATDEDCAITNQFISNVSFNTINNPSTCAESTRAGYTEYTNLSTSINRGQTYPITVTHGGTNTGSPEVKAWFDWNNDGFFDPSGEEFTLTEAFPNWTGDIMVPFGATLGSTRMRVRLTGNATPISSGFQFASEAEDYCIDIMDACTPPTVNAPTLTQPTCTTANGTIVVDATGSGTLEYSIDNGTTWQTSATFSDQPPGNYSIKVRLQDSPVCMTAYASNPVMLTAAMGCGTALEFDPGAPTDYVSCGNILTACYTKELWVNIVPSNGQSNNFISGGAAAPHTFWAPASQGYKVSAGHNTNFIYVQDPIAIPTGWHHYAVTYNSLTQIMRLYRDGVLVDEAFNVPALTGSNLVQIGAFDTGNGTDGKLDEVRIWNYARSEFDINCDKDAKLTGKESGLVAYYNFEQGMPDQNNAGVTTLYDLSTQGNNGTLQNFSLAAGSNSNWTQPGAPVSGAGSCPDFIYSLDGPKAISSSGTPTITSTLNVPISGTIIDINVVGLDVDHSWISDLRIKLKSPAGTERILLDRICNDEDDILIDMDDESPNAYGTIPCPPNGGAYQPSESLAAFDGENPNGTWTLTIEDLANEDGGSLVSWGLGISYTDCALPVIEAPTVTQTSCTTSTGSITVNASCSGTLEYSINNGVTWQASPTFTNLLPGAYNVVVRLQSSTACRTAYTSNPVLIESTPYSPTINDVILSQPSCASPTATIVIDATGIVVPNTPPSPLEYSIDNGATWQTSNTFSGLAAGNYDLQVRVEASPSCLTTYTMNPVVIATAPSCIPAKSLDFDGTDDYVALPANLTATLTSFTFEAWLYWDGSSNWQRIMDFGNNTSVYMFLTPNAGGSGADKPRFAITTGGAGGEQRINSSESAVTGQWQHYAVVLDTAANTGVLYIDGVQVGSNTGMTLTPADLGNLANNYLGKSQFASDPNFDGKLDDVRIWNYARTSQQIQCEKDATLTGSETGLIAHYHFNQGFAGGSNSGLTALDDQTASANDGTLVNFALSGDPSNWSGAAPSGKVLDFGGSADYVSIGNLGSVTDWTIETWFKPEGENNYENVFHSDDLGSGNGVRLEISEDFPDGHLYVSITENGGFEPHTIVPLSSSLPLDWNHVAIVGDKTNNIVRIYFNGTEVANEAHTDWPANFPDFVLGRGFSNGAERDFKGQLDEFRIWDHARTERQVLENKNVEILGSEPGLMAYYKFNQGVANADNTGLITLEDFAPGNNDGTLNGFALTGTSSNWAGPGALTDAPGTGCCPTVLYVRGIITSGTYQATTDVYSDGTVPGGSNVIFKGASSINLDGDFDVLLGGIFETIMQACTP